MMGLLHLGSDNNSDSLKLYKKKIEMSNVFLGVLIYFFQTKEPSLCLGADSDKRTVPVSVRGELPEASGI